MSGHRLISLADQRSTDPHPKENCTDTQDDACQDISDGQISLRVIEEVYCFETEGREGAEAATESYCPENA